ncbi:unnamed protein product, partial [Chrysoparadoxa australica]
MRTAGIFFTLLSLFISTRAFLVAPVAHHSGPSLIQRRGDMTMGKQSKFGIFSPAVIAAKVVVGEKRLNKFRGKAISLHAQTIRSYGELVGAEKQAV